mgnify:CR=1 FL=1
MEQERGELRLALRLARRAGGVLLGRREVRLGAHAGVRRVGVDLPGLLFDGSGRLAGALPAGGVLGAKHDAFLHGGAGARRSDQRDGEDDEGASGHR